MPIAVLSARDASAPGRNCARPGTFNIGNFGLADAGEFGYALLCPASKPAKVGHALGDLRRTSLSRAS